MAFMLLSPLFNQVRLSFNHEDFSNISVSYDKVFYKQDNIKLGIGAEYMSPRISTNVSDKEFSFDSIYMLMRFAYEKKWSSYLRAGINNFSSDNMNSDGMMIGFGGSYKLNDNWYINSGYHLYSADSYNYSSVIYSISRYFKASDED
jgi:hypothetical protein